MQVKPRAGNRYGPKWSRKLARVLTLEDGRELATLKDAANLVAERLLPVKAKGADVLAEALIEAAEGGDPDDIKDVTDRLWRELRFRHWLK